MRKKASLYTITAQTDTTMTLDIEIAGGGYWRFKLVKDRCLLRLQATGNLLLMPVLLA
jgi:hypothetical protein